MPPKSKAQKIAAIIAEKVKSGQAKAKPGSPSAKMAKMPKASLDEFAKLPVKKGKKK